MAKTMKATMRQRNRQADAMLMRKVIAMWQQRMDRLRVEDVAEELGKMVEPALRLAAWLERTERSLKDKHAAKVFGLLARHERVMAARLKEQQEKLNWCFQHQATEIKPNE